MNISKYENFNLENSLFKLKNNVFIIDKIVDENNHLWYVVKKDDDIYIKDAENIRIDISNTEEVVLSKKINKTTEQTASTSQITDTIPELQQNIDQM